MHLKSLTFFESLNKPYEYKWKMMRSETGLATFSADGRDMVVEIQEYEGDGEILYDDYEGPITTHPYESEAINVHEISFYEGDRGPFSGGKWDMSNKGDAFRIMATVLKIIEEYISKQKQHINAIGFSSSRGDRGRTALYNRLFKKLTPPGKWEKDTWKHLGTNYIMIKK